MNSYQIKTFLLFTFMLTISLFSLFESDNPRKVMKKYYHNCEYEKAIEQANIILKEQNQSKKDIHDILIVKGVSEFSLNKFLDARITFMELLNLDYSIELDSMETSPKIVNFFENIKSSKFVNYY